MLSQCPTTCRCPSLSNDDIAARLVVSPHTVHRHMANILTKLDEPTRASAVSHAMTDGMI